MGLEALVIGGLALAGASIGSGAGFTAAGLAIGAGVGVGLSAIGRSGGGKGDGSDTPYAPQPLPAPPKIDAAADEAQKQALKRRGAATKTVFTDPLGVGGQADIVRKTLTGQ